MPSTALLCLPLVAYPLALPHAVAHAWLYYYDRARCYTTARAAEPSRYAPIPRCGLLSPYGAAPRCALPGDVVVLPRVCGMHRRHLLDGSGRYATVIHTTTIPLS